jgi:hypothetical protein
MGRRVHRCGRCEGVSYVPSGDPILNILLGKSKGVKYLFRPRHSGAYLSLRYIPGTVELQPVATLRLLINQSLLRDHFFLASWWHYVPIVS